jgi:hypothetical protein
MGCAASSSSRTVLEPTEGTHVGVTSTDEEASQRGIAETNDDLQTHTCTEGQNLELPGRDGISNQPSDEPMDDGNEILASARQCAKRFAHGYARAVIVQYHKKDDATRPNIWTRRRYSQSADARHAAEACALTLHHGPHAAAPAPEHEAPNGTGKEQQRTPAGNACREPPMWIDASSSQSAASAGCFSLQQAYACQFEDRPPRLRPMLRKARRDARARAAAKAKAREESVQGFIGPEGTCMTHACTHRRCIVQPA